MYCEKENEENTTREKGTIGKEKKTKENFHDIDTLICT